MQQARNDERDAQHEAGLWQARCADLEYLLRSNGVAVPALSAELKALVSPGPQADQTVDWNITPDSGKPT
jgi:hypothetical protein